MDKWTGYFNVSVRVSSHPETRSLQLPAWQQAELAKMFPVSTRLLPMAPQASQPPQHHLIVAKDGKRNASAGNRTRGWPTLGSWIGVQALATANFTTKPPMLSMSWMM
jgi:hypothetical protein